MHSSFETRIIFIERVVLTNFSRHHSTPNRFAYQHLVGAYARVGDIDKVKEILATMDADGMEINDAAYNYLVRCYLKVG